MGKRIIEELATDTIQDNDFILMDNNTTPTDPDDDTAGTRKIRAKEFGAKVIPIDDELSTSSENPVQNKVITGAINDLASATEITGTASGSIASFDDGSTMPLKTLQVSIEPVQSGSGEPSPSNVRPISGWTSCNVTDCGVNLWGGYTMAQDINSKSSTSTIDTTNKTVTYDKASGSPDIFSMPFKENTRYTLILSASNSSSNTSLLLSYTNGTTDTVTVNTSGSKQVIVVTSASNKTLRSIKLSYYQTALTTVYYNESGLFEGVLTADDFVPYNGNTYNIAFTDGTNPLTVYGGTAKVFMDGGKWYCTVTKTSGIRKLSDMPTNRWNKLSSGTGAFYMGKGYSLPDISTEYSSADLTRAMLSDIYNKSPSGTMTEATFRVSDALYIVDSRYADITEFINAIPNNDASFIYPLATPTTTTFEIDTCIASLLGVNNVSADSGNVLACEYIKDTDIVIKKLLYKDLTATLSANATSLTITDSAITTDATYDIFTDTYGVSPTAVSVSNGSMTLTFTARSSATKVKVRVML